MDGVEREVERRRESGFHGMGGREPLADVPPEREEAVQSETSEQRVAERQLHELLKPSVLHLRRKLFDNERPRFDSWADAVAWLKNEAQRETEDPNPEEEVGRLVGEVLERLQRLNQLGGARRSLQVEYGPLLQYVEPEEEWVRYLRVDADSPLGSLAEGCDAVARAGGFQRWRAVRWVLTGEPPVLPPARVRAHHVNVELPDGRSLRRYYATVEVNVQPSKGLLPYRQWTGLRKLVRRIWNKPVPHTLSEKEQTLLEVVQEHGGPPQTKHDQDFWKQVLADVTEQGVRAEGNKPYQHYQSVSRAYYKAREKAQGIPWIELRGKS